MEKDLKKFHTALEKLSYNLGRDILDLFKDFLEYAISLHSFSIKKDMSGYSRETIMLFYEVYRQWILLQREMLLKNGYEWFDAFGTYFEIHSGQWSRKSKGQFFTPPHICDFMVSITVSEDDSKLNIPDPACGSGRLLIASHAYNPKNFHYGTDIDRLCCLMTSLNLMVHGARGEVVWKNALDPTDWRQGWSINPYILQLKGVPHIAILEKESSIIYYNDQSWMNERKNKDTEKSKEIQRNFFSIKDQKINFENKSEKANFDF